jgi:DNA-binding transcriptional LysR family regulator
MVRLQDLQLFIRSAVLGGFSEAAREANVQPSQVSTAIKRLEEELDVRLFARSTRTLRLTVEGERYLPYAKNVLDMLRAGHDHLRDADSGVSGLSGMLQIALPSDLGRNVLLPWLSAFQGQHPALVLRLAFADRVADVFRDTVDVAIRYGVGEEEDYFAIPIVPENRRVLCASPSYLKARGVPSTLAELAEHDCLLYEMRGKMHDKWTFVDGRQRQTVQVKGSMQSNDADIVRRLAVAGRGILYKSWLDVANDVKDGRLVQLFPHVVGEPTPLSLVYPHRGQRPQAIRLLTDSLRKWLEPIASMKPVRVQTANNKGR